MPVLPFVLRYVGVAVLLLSFHWLVESNETEAAIAFIVSLTAFIGQDIYFANKAKVLERNIQRDKKVLEDLLELIRPNHELWFLKNQDHGDGFHTSSFDNFLKFADTWNTVDREFVDPTLEALRKKLHKVGTDYAHKVAGYTFIIFKGYQRLPEELYERNPDKWEAQRTELNKLANEVVEAFELLVREGRKRL